MSKRVRRVEHNIRKAPVMIITPGEATRYYASIVDAASAIGVHPGTVSYNIRRTKDGKINTPNGVVYADYALDENSIEGAAV